MRVNFLIFICDNFFKSVTWLIPLFDMTHGYDFSMRVKWLIFICDIFFWNIWLDSFLYVTWLMDTLHVRDMTDFNFWLFFLFPLFMRDMSHSFVLHDSSICVTWFILVCDITHFFFWCDLTRSLASPGGDRKRRERSTQKSPTPRTRKSSRKRKRTRKREKKATGPRTRNPRHPARFAATKRRRCVAVCCSVLKCVAVCCCVL